MTIRPMACALVVVGGEAESPAASCQTNRSGPAAPAGEIARALRCFGAHQAFERHRVSRGLAGRAGGAYQPMVQSRIDHMWRGSAALRLTAGRSSAMSGTIMLNEVACLAAPALSQNAASAHTLCPCFERRRGLAAADMSALRASVRRRDSGPPLLPVRHRPRSAGGHNLLWFVGLFVLVSIVQLHHDLLTPAERHRRRRRAAPARDAAGIGF